jgi:branched-chain amino acid transport system permease protein
MIRRKAKLLFFMIGALAFLFTLPLYIPVYYVYLGSEILIYSIFAMSVYLLLGGIGLLSFGQAAYFGLGAYSCALILKHTQYSFWIAILLGISIGTIAAAIIGFLCVRRGKIYFAMLTLAFGQMIYAVVYKWYAVTGGEDGISGVFPRHLELFFTHINLSTPNSYFFFVAVVAVGSLGVLFLIMNSPFGLTLKSIRENQERAYYIGLNVRRFQIISFTVSSFFAALAGTLISPLTGQVSPDLAHWGKSVEPIIMILIGGANHFAGPIIGSTFYLFLGRLLRSITLYWMLPWGVILAVIVFFFPRGIFGLLSVIATFLATLLRRKD